jgi:uncharacterized protein (TIGR03435 family)
LHFGVPQSVVIENGPGWINSDRYQIDALAEDTPAKEMMNGPMLQALLEDRFHLKLHRETRELPAYALTVAKGGLKLQPYEEGSCVPWDMTKNPTPPLGGPQMPCSFPIPGSKRRGGPTLQVLELHGTSLDEFSRMLLSLILDRPVIDKTGVNARFDIHLEFAPLRALPGADPAILADDAGPSIFTALQEQLGLKLEPAKGPRDFLVIDHVERPSEN